MRYLSVFVQARPTRAVTYLAKLVREGYYPGRYTGTLIERCSVTTARVRLRVFSRVVYTKYGVTHQCDKPQVTRQVLRVTFRQGARVVIITYGRAVLLHFYVNYTTIDRTG